MEKWIDVEKPRENREFLTAWHYLLKALRAKEDGNEEEWKEMNLFFLQNFFAKPYVQDTDFYSQFCERKGIMEERYLV